MAAIKHTLSALVEDKPGVLNRVSSLILRRGFNIMSIAVGRSEIPGLSRMVIVVDGTNTAVDQVRKQLVKIVRVVKVTDISDESIVSRELALIKVKSTPETQSEIIQIATDVFRAHVVDINPESIMVEVSGDDDKVNSLIELFRGFGIIEVARTGLIAITRGTLGPLWRQESEQS
ncbi:MAG: acetolactate synthase small subunit [Dehalococcoidia bacterium]|nr:acetolactate synthase small subunit [Dehalococcoidia bacterium]